MKLFLSIIALQFFAPLLRAQWVVTNPISDALGEIQHFEDIAKAVEMINNQVEQINTLTQQLQQIQAYVKAFGDPSALVNIVGADALINSLQTSGVVRIAAPSAWGRKGAHLRVQIPASESAEFS